MTLNGNGKPDVRNHSSTHRKSNLHLVSRETQPDAAGPPQKNAEIAKASALDLGATSASQSAVGSSETAAPAAANEQTISETSKS